MFFVMIVSILLLIMSEMMLVIAYKDSQVMLWITLINFALAVIFYGAAQ